jgi:hypothetical protein
MVPLKPIEEALSLNDEIGGLMAHYTIRAAPKPPVE